MKKVLFVLFAVLIAAMPLLAQGDWQQDTNAPEWHYAGIFSSGWTSWGGTGIAMDHHNRLWFGAYPGGNRAIHVLGVDSTEASFSPITELAHADTMYNLENAPCYGMGVDADGNILYNAGAIIFKINAETGEALGSYDAGGSLGYMGVDQDGYIYVGHVVGLNPIHVFDPDPTGLPTPNTFDLPMSLGVSRGLSVSLDGKDIWAANEDKKVYNFHTEDYINYTVADSVFTNTDGDTIIEAQAKVVSRDPNGDFWISNDTDTHGDAQNHVSQIQFNPTDRTYYNVPAADTSVFIFPGPRGIAFSATGDTMYTVGWNSGFIFMFTKGPVGVADNPVPDVPQGYSLGQNYPNPFNPTTSFSYVLPKEQFVTITVYNALGQEVTKLVNEKMSAGTHHVSFDGSDLASGLYVYRLNAGKVNIAKEMILVK